MMLGLARKSGQPFDRDTIAWTKCTLRENAERGCYSLEAHIYWRLDLAVTRVMSIQSKIESRLLLLEKFFPRQEEQSDVEWSTRDFYNSVHIPPLNLKVASEIQSPDVMCTLYPFQKRAVNWLLHREGVYFQNGSLVPTEEIAHTPSFTATQDLDGRWLYISHFLGILTDNLERAQSSIHGGILAEEMGLGKTVELISLISLHKRKVEEERTWDAYSGAYVVPSGATLIITPPHILDQWMSELENHAPGLKVYHYTGIPSVSQAKKKDVSVADLSSYDVVLTTYNVLAHEVHYAKEVRDHGLRYKKYGQRRSPLVQISWWRVCLDEAQMVESGVSQAATVARLIPRINAWAVSGTPLKKDVEDLFGLLIFLRYEPYASARRLWAKVPLPIFRDIFGDIAMRHTKEKIREELKLPPQRRLVITVPFTAIEEQIYTQLFQEMCAACGFNADGSPNSDEFDPDSEVIVSKMRSWLLRLRQTCLHPQVGNRNRKALGRGNGPLRTVAEVLEVMIEQNEASTRDAERALVMSKVTQGHIHAYAKDDPKRGHNALGIYQAALETTQKFVDELRTHLSEEVIRVGDSADAVIKRTSVTPTYGEESDVNTDEDENSGPNSRLLALRLALRSALGLLHICTFYVATAYYQIKSDEEETKPDSEDFHRLEKLEIEYYDKAKAIRKEMLHDSHSKAERAMNRITAKQSAGKLTKIPVISPIKSRGGIENRKILDKMDELEELLNLQAQQLEEWRNQVIKILLMSLVDSDEETTGEEYEDSTKSQDELYVYLAVLRAIVADRHHALTGQQNFLIDNEMRDYVRQANQEPPQGHAPELLLKVMEKRQRLRLHSQDASLRAVVSELRSLATSLDGAGSRAEIERQIVEEELSDIQAISSAQVKTISRLERELHMFTGVMNLRVEYYRQLQRISDTVAPYKEELDEVLDHRALDSQLNLERSSEDQVATLKTKHRFLLHLRTESDATKERDCVICRQPIENGVLTVCGHQYCKDCIRIWWTQHRTCPVCKRRLHQQDFHAITYKPQEIKAQEEQHTPPSPEQSTTMRANERRQSATIYISMAKTTMDAIKSIDLDGSYGTKIDTIARHLLYLREADPGSKSIIFSQYSDFLEVLERAFRQFKIGCTGISAKKGVEKFRKDASIECFLLDAKSDSSGLNLVNATHVFLCEPLINTALELQAIARVHRIGQQRPTAVYQYLINGTVEEAIYDISVARRLAHVARTSRSGEDDEYEPGHSGTVTPLLQESAIDAANSLELQQAPLSKLLMKGKGGGERVEKGDLWNCLFSKSRVNEHEGVGEALEREVGRHLRAEAAESRRTAQGS